MSLVDAILMSSAIKDKAKALVTAVPAYAAGAFEANSQQSGSSVVIENKERQAHASEAFRGMCRRFNPTVNENVGYMFVLLDQETYQPG